MKFARIAGFALAAALVAPTFAAENAYLFLKGQKSGNINGSVTLKGFENSIQVDSVAEDVVSPRDPQSGLPTGQRLHKPLILVISLDKSWPLLMNVMSTNENLANAEIRFVVPDARTGANAVQRTIRLTNANIAEIQDYTVDAATGTPKGSVVKLQLTYQKIEWTWTAGGITAMDDWEARI